MYITCFGLVAFPFFLFIEKSFHVLITLSARNSIIMQWFSISVIACVIIWQYLLSVVLLVNAIILGEQMDHLRTREKEFSQTNYSLISIRLIRVTNVAL